MKHVIQKFKAETANELVEAFSENRAPWQQVLRPEMLPHNPVTGIVYSGINQLILQLKTGQDPRWITFYEAKQKKWNVQKGSKGTHVTLLKPIIDLDTEEETGIVIQRLYTVFNACQINGINAYAVPEQEEAKCLGTEYVIGLILEQCDEGKTAMFKKLLGLIGAMFLLPRLGVVYRPIDSEDTGAMYEYLRRNPLDIFSIAGTANRIVRKLINHKEAI